MNDFIFELKTKLSILYNFLSSIKIEYGVFTEDAIQSVTVKVLNTDDSITQINMTIGDVMYFTEYGTLTIPARPILNNCIHYISTSLENEITQIIDNVLNYNWSKDQIMKKLNDFSTKTEIYIRSKIDEMVATNATIANLINIKDENKYLYDLKKLKNYIKCKIIFS